MASTADDTDLVAKKSIGLANCVLIMGNFENFPDLETLLGNEDCIFNPPSGEEWKGCLKGFVEGPLFALQFDQSPFLPDGWMLGSENSDDCDLRLAPDVTTGISRQHLRITVEARSKCPRLIQVSGRNDVLVIEHSKKGDFPHLLGPQGFFSVRTSAPITVKLGNCSFQAWRPRLSDAEKTDYEENVEKFMSDYIDSLRTFPAIRHVSGAETARVRFGAGAVYRVVNELGIGSFATVYLVVEEISKKLYAAKQPHYRTSDTAVQRVSRFEAIKTELDMLRRLDHRHILTAFDVLSSEDKTQPPWIITEFIEFDLGCNESRHQGNTLLDVRKYLTSDDSVVMASQILDGLAYLHDEAKVAHRDIKPSNILVRGVSGRFVAKIADFGFAKLFNEKMGSRVGTSMFMAPELLLSKPEYGTSVDSWSAGLVVLYLCSGWDPDTDSVWAKVSKGLLGSRRHAAWVHDNLKPFMIAAEPPAIRQLLPRMICISPQDRWTAREAFQWMQNDFPLPSIENNDAVGDNEPKDINSRKRRKRGTTPSAKVEEVVQGSQKRIRSGGPSMESSRARHAVDSGLEDDDGSSTPRATTPTAPFPNIPTPCGATTPRAWDAGGTNTNSVQGGSNRSSLASTAPWGNDGSVTH